jgi:hypothetical protein
VNGMNLQERIGELDQRIDDLEKRPRVSWVSWIAFALSAFSLLFLDIPERFFPPAVKLFMPSQARLAQIPIGETYSVRVYLQPAFATTGRSHRVGVLHPINLYVKREGEQQCKKFWLDGTGSLTKSTDEMGLEFTFESGARPLLVTQDAPQDHVLAFKLRKDEEHPNVEEPYFVGKHNYLMTLVANTTSNKTLKSTISVSADQAALEKISQRYLGQPNIRNFVTSGATKVGTPDDCPSFLDK